MNNFKDKEILITGGLGFIGSNLAITLVNLGAKVTIVDAMIEEYGGNLFNIEPIKDGVLINYADIRDESAMRYLVKNKDYIFHLAGQVCHVKSLSDPFPDIDINIKGTAVLMEACKQYNRDAVLIYTGTRGQYGSKSKLPVCEEAVPEPKGIYEISNLAAEHIIKVYNDIHGIRSVMLRLTNIYGPRAQMKHSRYGVANWFVRQVIDNKPIKVFGDGKIMRDFLFVEDTVEALLMCAVCDKAWGEIFNVGIDEPTTFLELVEQIIASAEQGRWEFAPFSAERKAQEPGHYYSDISKIKDKVGWAPRTGLADGLSKTIDYYRKYQKYYWDNFTKNQVKEHVKV